MTRWNEVKSFVAGGIAGCVAKTTTAPMDRFKVLLQGHHDFYKSFNVWKGMRAVVQHEGYRGLYKGNGAMMVRVYPYAGIQFLSYEQYKKLTKPYFSSQSHLNKLFSGSMAGTTAVMLTYPLDLVRTKLAFQVDHKHYLGIRHALVTIVRSEGGVLSLYRGIVPAILGMIPYSGLSFYSYEVAKSYMLKNVKFCTKYSSGTIVLTVPANLICGGLAGAVAQSFSYPLDVARRNMQLSRKQDLHRHNLRATLRHILNKYGVQGFFRGLSINYYRAIPARAVSFTAYEQCKQLLSISKP